MEPSSANIMCKDWSRLSSTANSSIVRLVLGYRKLGPGTQNCYSQWRYHNFSGAARGALAFTVERNNLASVKGQVWSES